MRQWHRRTRKDSALFGDTSWETQPQCYGQTTIIVLKPCGRTIRHICRLSRKRYRNKSAGKRSSMNYRQTRRWQKMPGASKRHTWKQRYTKTKSNYTRPSRRQMHTQCHKTNMSQHTQTANDRSEQKANGSSSSGVLERAAIREPHMTTKAVLPKPAP